MCSKCQFRRTSGRLVLSTNSIKNLGTPLSTAFLSNFPKRRRTQPVQAASKYLVDESSNHRQTSQLCNDSKPYFMSCLTPAGLFSIIL